MSCRSSRLWKLQSSASYAFARLELLELLFLLDDPHAPPCCCCRAKIPSSSTSMRNAATSTDRFFFEKDEDEGEERRDVGCGASHTPGAGRAGVASDSSRPLRFWRSVVAMGLILLLLLSAVTSCV